MYDLPQGYEDMFIIHDGDANITYYIPNTHENREMLKVLIDVLRRQTKNVRPL